MRIRRRDREASESSQAGSEPAPYDYDRDVPVVGIDGPTSLDPVKSLTAEPAKGGTPEHPSPGGG